MVVLGMGISFLPALYVRAALANDSQIACRQIAGTPPSRTLGMVWRRRSSRDEEYSAFAKFLRDVLSRRVPEITPLS